MVLVGAFLVLVGAFFRTQVLQHDKFQLKAETNRLRPIPLPPPRGTIFDRNGRVIAENVPGFSVKLLASSVDSLKAVLTRVRRYVPLDSVQIGDIVERYAQARYQPALVFGDEGLLRSGLLVRVLVLPNNAAAVTDSLAWIAETLSPRVAISLMSQYYPIHRAAGNGKYSALSRSITAAEWEEALAALEANGMQDGYHQEFETAHKYYRPDFRDRETPFRDIRDFRRVV